MFKKILITTDGSALSTQAAKAGVAFAHSVGAEVVALHVQQPFLDSISYEALSDAYSINHVDYQKVLAEQAEQFLQPIVAEGEQLKVPVKTRSIYDANVAHNIVKVAEQEDCHLIFIGSHGRSGLSLLLLGSVAAKVIPLSHISVMVYRVQEAKKK